MNKKTVPFAVLFVVHAILIARTLQKGGRTAYRTLTFAVGLAYMFEYIVLNVFRMYMYYPKVFKERVVDSVLGALLSQSVFVPAAAVYLAMFDKGLGWAVSAALAYGAVERLFIAAKLFRPRTWRTTMTVVGLPIYFWLTKLYLKAVQRNHNGFLYHITLFMSFWIQYTNGMFWMLSIQKRFLMQTNLVKGKYWDHFVAVPLYAFVASIQATVSVLSKKLWLKLGSLAALMLFDRLLVRTKLLWFRYGKVRGFLLLHLAMLLVGELNARLFRQKKKEA